jgi:predicted nucleic acid-binding protein
VIVIDATTIVSGLLTVGSSREALETNDLHIPHLADSEVVSALTRLVRNEAVDARGAKRALDRWVLFGVRRHPVRALMPRMWELRQNVKADDATYVALAERLDLPLVTCDKRLAHAPGITCEVLLMPGSQQS